MATVHDVAAALIGGQTAAGRTIDKMQLQKLLYLVQGGNLARTSRPAFTATIRAYKYGPVVTEVEDTYRSVVSGTSPIERPLGGDPARLDPATVEVVADVLAAFGEFTGPNLEKFTKKPRSPWHLARPGLDPGAPSRNPIDVNDIADWFAEHPLDPNGSSVYAPTRDVDLDALASAPVGGPSDEAVCWDAEDVVDGGYVIDRSKFMIIS